MKRKLLHIIIPSTISIVFFINAFMPVEVLGCRNRGLVALTISSVSTLLTLTAAIAYLRAKFKEDQNAFWWLISVVLLVIPVIGIIILA
jgi:hypothetical protein